MELSFIEFIVFWIAIIALSPVVTTALAFIWMLMLGVAFCVYVCVLGLIILPVQAVIKGCKYVSDRLL